MGEKKEFYATSQEGPFLTFNPKLPVSFFIFLSFFPKKLMLLCSNFSRIPILISTTFQYPIEQRIELPGRKRGIIVQTVTPNRKAVEVLNVTATYRFQTVIGNLAE